ncbi:MAG: endo-alpha-N-acetylgalactosaminidase family protein [Spirochaetia bacterium]|jgi:hypothetical protein
MGSLSLKQGTIRIDFHDRFPVVLRYTVGQKLIMGDADPEEPACLVYSPDFLKNMSSADAGLQCSSRTHHREGEVEYSLSLSRDGRRLISFTVAFALEGSACTVTLRDVVEMEEYQLVSIDLKRLASAVTTDPKSRVALPAHGGRRIDPARCEAGEQLHRYNWVRDAFCQVALVYTSGASATLQLASLNDQVLSSVSGPDTRRHASIGVRIAHRMEARAPHLQFVVHSPSRVRIALLATDQDDPNTGWIPAARALHTQTRNLHPDRYAGRFVYKVFVGKPGSPAEVPFDAVIDGVRRRFHLFDGAGQVCYLIGFQHEGHDSGYPDVFTVNEAAGGAEKLTRIIAEASTYNTTMSFHDNYDDAYQSSPAWDPRDIAVDSRGELLRGGTWNGIQAYWISLPKYVRDKALTRIRRTLAQYPVRDTYHLDVLTASVFRPDFDPACPSDKNDDLAARKRLVDLFRAEGIDVTSEGCGLPFLETFRYFWDLPRPGASVYEGDEPIPLAPFIAHGTVGYGGSEADRYGIVEGLFCGAFHSKDFTFHTTEAEMLDAFYLLHVPLNPLRGKAMVDYKEQGALRKITYEGGDTVEVDFQRCGHRVTIGGNVLVEDFISFAPGPKSGTYLAYISLLSEMGTRHGHGPWPCPREWRGAKELRAIALTPSGEGETCFIPVLENGTISLDLPAGIPHHVLPE